PLRTKLRGPRGEGQAEAPHEGGDEDAATCRDPCVGRRSELRGRADQAPGAATRNRAARAGDQEGGGPGEAPQARDPGVPVLGGRRGTPPGRRFLRSEERRVG